MNNYLITFISFIIFTILFCIFIEFSIGSISYRLNSSNEYTFQIKSLLNYLVHPLYNSFLWNPSLLIYNYPFMLFVFMMITFNLFL